MATRAQLEKLDARIDALAAAITPDSEAVTVVVFDGETPAEAARRHRDLRPDHAGRLVRFEHRRAPRTKVEEMFAVHTPAEIRAVIERIDANGRGKTMGERMLADVHGWDADERA
jgi:ATP phosphoribosyltransferase regulatory subunit HisZ